MGRVAFLCDPCQRNKSGLCRDCPSKLAEPNAMRCKSCAHHRRLEGQRVRDRLRYAARRKEVLAHHKKRNDDPAWREWRRNYMRAYRVANPRNDFDRAYMRVYMAKRRSDPAYREKYNARRRLRRANRRQERAA